METDCRRSRKGLGCHWDRKLRYIILERKFVFNFAGTPMQYNCLSRMSPLSRLSISQLARSRMLIMLVSKVSEERSMILQSRLEKSSRRQDGTEKVSACTKPCEKGRNLFVGKIDSQKDTGLRCKHRRVSSLLSGRPPPLASPSSISGTMPPTLYSKISRVIASFP